MDAGCWVGGCSTLADPDPEYYASPKSSFLFQSTWNDLWQCDTWHYGLLRTLNHVHGVPLHPVLPLRPWAGVGWGGCVGCPIRFKRQPDSGSHQNPNGTPEVLKHAHNSPSPNAQSFWILWPSTSTRYSKILKRIVKYKVVEKGANLVWLKLLNRIWSRDRLDKFKCIGSSSL